MTSARGLDAAMEAIERENPTLKDVLPKNYTQRELGAETIGGLIDTFSRQDLAAEEFKDLDVLGRVYEYSLGQICPRTRARRLANSTRHAPWSGSSSRCCSHIMAVSSTGLWLRRHVCPGGQIRPQPTGAAATTSPSSVKSRTHHVAASENEPRVRGIEGNPRPRVGRFFSMPTRTQTCAPTFVIANPPFNDSSGVASGCAGPAMEVRRPAAAECQLRLAPGFLHHCAPTWHGSAPSSRMGRCRANRTVEAEIPQGDD
jgi:type I restriction enzyme M protein